MQAQSGIVWWKAVSKTATLGTPLKIFSHASMPPRFAGMCKGPNFTSFWHLAMTAFVTLTESLKTSAPWSTRCPMASMSSGLPRSATTCSRASAWLAGPPAPMRSTSPFARRSSFSMSKSWYFRELEPELTTSTFLIVFFIRFVAFCFCCESFYVAAPLAAQAGRRLIRRRPPPRPPP